MRMMMHRNQMHKTVPPRIGNKIRKEESGTEVSEEEG